MSEVQAEDDSARALNFGRTILLLLRVFYYCLMRTNMVVLLLLHAFPPFLLCDNALVAFFGGFPWVPTIV